MDSKALRDDLCKAVTLLENALKLEAANDVLKAGCIQYFEFCFELAWKTAKRFAEDEGQNECNSPKAALKQAFANGWVNDEDVWLDMLSARNRMAHTYKAEDALAVFDSLPAYLKAFKALVTELAAA